MSLFHRPQERLSGLTNTGSKMAGWQLYRTPQKSVAMVRFPFLTYELVPLLVYYGVIKILLYYNLLSIWYSQQSHMLIILVLIMFFLLLVSGSPVRMLNLFLQISIILLAFLCLCFKLSEILFLINKNAQA